MVNMKRSIIINRGQSFAGLDQTYNISYSLTELRVYSIPTLNKEIKVPEQLFKLNTKLQDHYKMTNTKDLAKYKLNKGNFELKTKDNN